jgi:hypothetical protein
MNDTKTAASSGGIGFFGLLGIVFITLKLTGYINWSWWLVTAPLWGPPAAVLSVAALMFALAGILMLCGLFATAVVALYESAKR